LDYIELALRERLKINCPNFGQSTIAKIVDASMDGLNVSKEVLYRAIEMASENLIGDKQ
jgi:hypothetical protein